VEPTTLTEALRDSLGISGEIFFRFVPAVIESAFGSDPTRVFVDLKAPLYPNEVSDLLAQSSYPGTFEALTGVWQQISLVSLWITLPLIALSIYCGIRIIQVRRFEERNFLAMQQTVAAGDVPKTQLRWNRIVDQVSSSEPTAWRLAILEADIMLGELLDSLGYRGDTVADKLKNVGRERFNSIDAVWEAHRLRNRIAHEGGDDVVTQREAVQAIGLYERAFREFGFMR
jgi:hypothetical protein